MVIKIVNDELVVVMGSEMTEIALKPGNEITVIMIRSQVLVRRQRQRLPESSRQREEIHCW